MKKDSILVIGAGTMGNGIAHVFAQAGYSTTLVDLQPDFLKKALATIETNLSRQVAKGLLTEEDKVATIGRLSTSTDLKSAAPGKSLIVEAATENPDVKTALFRSLDEVSDQAAILATNTSSISITRIAAATRRPGQVIGMHFMNPVPVMKLVEIIRGYSTSDQTYLAVKKYTEDLQKIPVEVNDYPGFISNRILMPMINEAIYTVYEGVATPEAVDQIMKLGMAHPMGPLQLADFIGLDVCLAIMNVLHDGFSDSKYRPCPLLKKMVAAGHLGKKTGSGFYSYDQKNG
ncbi:MAG: 3-hydroxybutyryl-CoA dehydrogenase [Bacteroidetes bacterium]|nr:3-hydroxybutyryl-CoA dehydrogenase [Bacteroidota bacterium]